jgi:hypothetical protein
MNRRRFNSLIEMPYYFSDQKGAGKTQAFGMDKQVICGEGASKLI